MADASDTFGHSGRSFFRKDLAAIVTDRLETGLGSVPCVKAVDCWLLALWNGFGKPSCGRGVFGACRAGNVVAQLKAAAKSPLPEAGRVFAFPG